SQPQHSGGAPGEPHGGARDSPHGGAGAVRCPQGARPPAVTRRELLAAAAASPMLLGAREDGDAGFRLVDVTGPAGIQFIHNSGAFGGKYLPETMGAGCAFL